LNLIDVFLVSLLGYLLGCIQTAYFVGKFCKSVDIRKLGTKNAGASNVTALMGWKYGGLTAIVDIVKATAAVVITREIYPQYPVLFFVAGSFVLIGHIFPFFLGFKGGKGVASLVGMGLGINIKIGLLTGVLLILLTIIFDYIAIGSITMYLSMPVFTYAFGYSQECIIIVAVLALLGVYKHLSNVKRIIAHEEKGLRAVIKNKIRL